MLVYARAKPAEIRITEHYRYTATIDGNSTLEMRGDPEGEVFVRLPCDGFQHFSRQAYRDYLKQATSARTGQTDQIRFGYLAFSGISGKEFWPDIPANFPRTILNLDFSAPQSRTDLVWSQDDICLQHPYRPDPPKVDPRPHPIWIQCDVYDERTVADLYGNQLSKEEWERFVEDLSFERTLILSFQVLLALPGKIGADFTPILKKARLHWPETTSHHNLDLRMDPENGKKQWGHWPQQSVFYFPGQNSEKGWVEWRKVPFRPGRYPHQEEQVAPSDNPERPNYWHLPVLVLQVSDPGEFYQEYMLDFDMEVHLPGVLASGADTQRFSAIGQPVASRQISKNSTISAAGTINLHQRFIRRTLSPHQKLQFEGVILENARVIDITMLLKDNGFQELVTQQVSNDPDHLYSAIIGRRIEGPDRIDIWILAQGKLEKTERESEIPGGRKFKSALDRGHTVLDIRCELRGNISKLTNLMNDIHRALKDRFRHISTLE